MKIAVLRTPAYLNSPEGHLFGHRVFLIQTYAIDTAQGAYSQWLKGKALCSFIPNDLAGR